MFNPLDNALIFLIQTLFDLYILILMLRVILQWVGAHFYNPVSQFILKLTNPVIMPLRKIIPPIRGIDLASFSVLLLLEFIKLMILIFLKTGAMAAISGILVMAFADILDVILDIFFFAVIINILLSWVNPGVQTPLSEVLYLMTEPLLRPARRVLPSIAGFDLSPIPVLIVLQLCAILITQPLLAIGYSLAA